MKTENKEIKYKIMLLDRNIKSTEFIFDNMDNQLKLYEKAYATEMSLLNEEPESTFDVNDDMICLAFTEEWEFLGFLDFGVSNYQYLFINHVYVNPAYRGKGIYTNMLSRVYKFAKDIGCKKICAFVFETNKASKKAHSKLGFSKKISGYIKEVKQ